MFHTGTGGAGSYDGPWEAACRHHWKLKVFSHREPKLFKQTLKKWGFDCKHFDASTPHCFSWDVKSFMADWPQDAQEQLWAGMMLQKIKNQVDSNSGHWFKQSDDATAAISDCTLEEMAKHCEAVSVET